MSDAVCCLTHLVVACHVGDTPVLSCQLVLDLVDGIILDVDRANQQIVGDVVQVAAKFQPRPGSTDVVSGALSLHLQRCRRREEGDEWELQTIRKEMGGI